MKLKYTCRYCGATNTITSLFRWFFTPHLGAKKRLKCQHCNAKKHFMHRQNWNHPWTDWPSKGENDD